MCPALILASNRKLSVIGRTIKLISSMILRKGAKYHGVFRGNRQESISDFTNNTSILPIHRIRASLRLNLIVVVMGYLKHFIDIRLRHLNIRNHNRKYHNKHSLLGNILLLNALISSLEQI